MNRPKFKRLCAAVASGEDKFLENTRNRQAGQVISCTSGHAQIDIYGKKEIWRREECREFYLPVVD